MKEQRKQNCSDVVGLRRSSPEKLLGIVGLLLKYIALADQKNIEVPPEFLEHFGLVRNVLMRKCIGSDYTEAQFREFFNVAFLAAVRDYGMTEQRANSIRVEANQLLQ